MTTPVDFRDLAFRLFKALAFCGGDKTFSPGGSMAARWEKEVNPLIREATEAFNAPAPASPVASVSTFDQVCIDLPQLPSTEHLFCPETEHFALGRFSAQHGVDWWQRWVAAGHDERMREREEAWGILRGHIDPAPAAPVDPAPIPMRLTCPGCGELHIDEGEFATKPHHTHACQACGAVWRPAVVHTVGVRFLPGFKNAPKETP